MIMQVYKNLTKCYIGKTNRCFKTKYKKHISELEKTNPN